MAMFMENYRKQQAIIETPNVEMSFFAEAYQVSEEVGIMMTVNELYNDVKDILYIEAEGEKKEGFIRKIINFFKKIGTMFVKVMKSIFSFFYKNKDKDRNIVYYIQKELEGNPDAVEKNKSLKEKFSDIVAGIKNGEIAKFITQKLNIKNTDDGKRSNAKLNETTAEYNKTLDAITKIHENIAKLDIAEATKKGLTDEVAKDITRISKYISFKMNIILAAKFTLQYRAQVNAIIANIAVKDIDYSGMVEKTKDEMFELLEKDHRFTTLIKEIKNTYKVQLAYLSYSTSGDPSVSSSIYNNVAGVDTYGFMSPYVEGASIKYEKTMKLMASNDISKQVKAINEYANEINSDIGLDKDSELEEIMNEPSKTIQDLTNYILSKYDGGDVDEFLTSLYINSIFADIVNKSTNKIKSKK